MLNRLKNILKRTIAGTLCLLCVTTTLVETLPLALAKGSDGILNTNAALGSPILNNNFTINDWNKWEMVCWGVFLSNFCVPLIDDYESAFMTGNAGSNGSGYKALCFGTGNDPTNNATIESLTSYAAVQQRVVQKDIYVNFSKIANIDADGKALQYTEELKDPNDSQEIANELRLAKFKDFFFSSEIEAETTCAKLVQKGGLFDLQDQIGIEILSDYPPIAFAIDGYVPTFWIRSGTNYVKILDYRDSWDVQMMSLIINATRGDSQYSNEFAEKFVDLCEDTNNDSSIIRLDTFGNITVNGKMLLPASVNKNITIDKDINIMNSFVMNGYSSTYSNKQISLGLRQDNITPPIEKIITTDWGINRRGGVPAFGESYIGNVCLLYYDTDTAVLNTAKSGGTPKYGDALLDVFKATPKSDKTSLNMKIEISDKDHEVTHNGSWTKFFESNPDILSNTKLVTSAISDMNIDGTKGHKVLDYIVDMYGNKTPLYSDNGVVIANQLETAKGSEKTSAAAVRSYYNFIYQVWCGNISSPTLNTKSIESELSGANYDKFKSLAIDGNSFGSWWKAFITYDASFKNLQVGDLKKGWKFWDLDENDIFTKNANRAVKVFPVSEEMRAIASIFGVRDGTEFSTYSTMIYMTYLDFYDIATDTSSTGAKSKSSGFNPEIYDESSDILNVDLNDIIDVMSEEELRDEVLNYSYLMLHPEKGREYRQQLIENSVADWIYEQYNRIVYGGYKETYDGSTSKSNSGFLSIETYTDNFLTSWFLKSYVTIAIWLMGICTIAVIIIGLIQHKKMSWFALSILVVINSILLVPSSGEIVPYVTSNIIQNMFSSKMTYWSISQGITNASLESSASSKGTSGYLKNLSPEEATAVNELVKQLSVIYTDRSLMVKQDISQKVTQETVGVYSDIQSIQSARWILPMVMQQFTGDNNTANYIYKPLANIWDDMSNMYWCFNPMDAQVTETQSHTATSDQEGPDFNTSDKYNKLKEYYQDYNDAKSIDNINTNDINCRSYSYSIKDVAEMSHIVFSYLPDSSRHALSIASTIGLNGENYVDADSWRFYIDNAAKNLVKSQWMTTAKGGFEETADSYNRNRRETITEDMTYLLSTENPIYYFYCLIKDTFDSDETLGSVIGKLQGQIKKDEEGNEVRANFMYATIGNELNTDSGNLKYTGYVRDVLDLEELFHNVIPYLYEMQLSAGGFDGVSGILGDEEITKELQYYEGNMQSWMYRCNWATKIMENPDYSEGYNVRKADGSSVWVPNPALASTYPSDRPMVFSEAQKQAMGLDDGDLTIVELKCIEANEKAAKQWTLLINYAGASGLTKEVLLRQMATDATLIFCNEFSSSGVINTTYTMYPQSLDLRYLSFDSVMKMLVMNVSKNTSYIYSDTMSTLIEDTDMVTAVFLLVDAYLCAYIIPFIRTALMAMIFFLGFFAIVRSLFSSKKFKAQIACGQFLMNLVFMVYTILYYAVFSILMALTSSDEVLTTSNFSSNAGNPVWILIVVAAAGGFYTFLMIKQIIFCWKHKRDMGFEAMSVIASGIVGNISDAMSNVGGKIQNFFNSEANTSYNTSNTNSIKGTGTMQQDAQDVNVKQVAGSTIKVEREDEMKDNVFMDAEYMGNYNNLSEVENIDSMQAAEIDAEIEKGEELKID